MPLRAGGPAAARTREKPDSNAIAQAADSVNLALTEVRSYLSNIEVDPEDRLSEDRRIADVHIIDHLQRLAAVVVSKDVYPGSARLQPLEQRLAGVLDKLAESAAPPSQKVCALAAEIADTYRAQRQTILQEAARAGSDPAGLLQELDTLQWLNRIAFHFCSIETHLASLAGE